MNRRKLLASVGTAATIGFAGCSSDTASNEPNGDQNESDDGGTAGTDGPTLEEFQFPEHATRTDFSGSDFVPAHFDRLRDEGSATISVSTESVFSGNETEGKSETRISADGLLRVRERSGSTTETWTEMGTERGLIRRKSGFNTNFQITHDSPDESEALAEREAKRFAEGFEFSEAKSAENIDGTLTARYDVTEIADSESISRLVFADEITDAVGSVYITESGSVKRFTYDIDFQSEGRERRETVDVTYGDIGATTVTEPDWASTAREKGREFAATTSDDGYLQLELVNGEPIPAGVRLDLSLQGSFAQTTLSTEIGVGDRIVAAVDGRDVSIGVNEKPAPTSTFDSDFFTFSARSNGSTIYRDSFDFYSR